MRPVKCENGKDVLETGWRRYDDFGVERPPRI